MICLKKEIEAVSIKKAMKCYGIDVLSCKQSNLGVTIVINSEVKNQIKALQFFAEFELCYTPNLKPKLTRTSNSYVDYGTLFVYETI